MLVLVWSWPYKDEEKTDNSTCQCKTSSESSRGINSQMTALEMIGRGRSTKKSQEKLVESGEWEWDLHAAWDLHSGSEEGLALQTMKTECLKSQRSQRDLDGRQRLGKSEVLAKGVAWLEQDSVKSEAYPQLDHSAHASACQEGAAYKGLHSPLKTWIFPLQRAWAVLVFS